MTLSIEARALIGRAMAKREALGLHVHWRLPDGKIWSAYAKDGAQKAAWIAGGKRKGWVYLPELDSASGPHSAAKVAS